MMNHHSNIETKNGSKSTSNNTENDHLMKFLDMTSSKVKQTQSCKTILHHS